MALSSSFSLVEGQFIEGTPYRVVRAIDLGGMGEVYEVDHIRTGTRRAIKVVRGLSDPRAQAAERLCQEGMALRMLDHPNVVRVFELGALPDGRPYVAMELLEGATIRALLHRHLALGVRRSARLVLQALEGLQAVHDAGMVHRDVKPTNLLVCAGDRLKLLDFGVAKWVRGNAGGVSTSTGQVLGTARYMAPEQLRGKAVDGRADQYAAALVFFEAVTGVHPFQLAAGSTGSVVARLHRPAPRLGDHCAEPVSAALEAVVARALAIDPDDRFPTALAFARAIRACVPEVESLRADPIDPCATTRLQAACVSWSGPQATGSTCPVDVQIPADTRPEEPMCTPTSATRPVGRIAADRLQRLGVASSLCALLLALTAVCVATAAAWTPSSQAARALASDCASARLPSSP